jgi:hypothetical protein
LSFDLLFFYFLLLFGGRLLTTDEAQPNQRDKQQILHGKSPFVEITKLDADQEHNRHPLLNYSIELRPSTFIPEIFPNQARKSPLSLSISPSEGKFDDLND